MRSYIKRIHKILNKQSKLRIVGELRDYDRFMDWQDKEIIAPLVVLGHKAIEDMLSIFRTAPYNQRTILVRALSGMGYTFPDDKAKIIAALARLLEDAGLEFEGEMKREIRLQLEILKQ